MKSFSAVLVSVLTLGSGYAMAQELGGQPQLPVGPEGQVQAGEIVQPATAAPNEVPPPPPEQLPPPPQPRAESVPAAPEAAVVPQTGGGALNASGQWVYTQQYGWVWMPYGAQYVYDSSDQGSYPYQYAYEPTDGWTWLSAPWVLGLGAAPDFGVYGPSHYPWYSRAVYSGRYARAYGYGYAGAGGYDRSQYYRPGYNGYGPGYNGYGSRYRGGYGPGYGAGFRAAPRSGFVGHPGAAFAGRPGGFTGFQGSRFGGGHAFGGFGAGSFGGGHPGGFNGFHSGGGGFHGGGHFGGHR